MSDDKNSPAAGAENPQASLEAVEEAKETAESAEQTAQEAESSPDAAKAEKHEVKKGKKKQKPPKTLPSEEAPKEETGEGEETDAEPPGDLREALLDVAKPEKHFLLHFFRKNSLPNLVLVLAAVCAFTAVLLAAVYQLTEPRIRAEQERAVQESLNLVFSENLNFSLSPYDERVYEGRDAGDNLVGFAVMVSPTGYGGAIHMIVGVDLGCDVSGVTIVSHRETQGYGSKTQTEPWFLEQFAGKGTGFVLGDGIDGIAGATRSSAAVTAGVSEAVNIVELLLRTNGGGTENP